LAPIFATAIKKNKEHICEEKNCISNASIKHRGETFIFIKTSLLVTAR